WEAIPPQCPVNLPAFLGKITRNLALNRYRYYVREKRGCGQIPLVLDELQECVPAVNSTEQAVEEKHLVEVLNRFTHELPVEKRMMFVRRYWYLSSIGEIAEDFEISEGKVKMTLLRIRNKLKQTLEKEGIVL
ncbi:MAG: RNA polymerase sigma factor, partial [Lachnospiraceae bacterium]|nr:RNA polymerase sigma factor [Lachnospiraceae bacterium]